MKKLVIILGLVLLIATPASAWNLFFIAQQEVIGQDAEGQDIYGYKLGPTDTIVRLNKTWPIKNVGNTYFFMIVVKNSALASEIITTPWTEFRAIGQGSNPYMDFAMRIALGLSGGTLNELKYIVGVEWYSGGEWHHGDVHEWEAAGSPSNVMFGPVRGILGSRFVGLGD